MNCVLHFTLRADSRSWLLHAPLPTQLHFAFAHRTLTFVCCVYPVVCCYGYVAPHGYVTLRCVFVAVERFTARRVKTRCVVVVTQLRTRLRLLRYVLDCTLLRWVTRLVCVAPVCVVVVTLPLRTFAFVRIHHSCTFHGTLVAGLRFPVVTLVAFSWLPTDFYLTFWFAGYFVYAHTVTVVTLPGC